MARRETEAETKRILRAKCNTREMKTFWDVMGLLAAVVMPIWNVPLIVRIARRKTADDISLAWMWGVWACMVLMLPAAFASRDITLKAFSISNVFFFSGVVIVVLLYRRPPK
jgi:uncharacterized protein with PQ loop repeat